VHRRLEDGDLYHVSNRDAVDAAVEASFRVTGKAPELWYADTGRRVPVSYRIEGGRTIVPLQLDPLGAVFVVFREPTTVAQRNLPVATRSVVATLEGPWPVSFQSGRGAPASSTLERLASWTTSSDAGIKYFSGTASYRRALDVPRAWLAEGSRVELDLGAVKSLAEVLVNGRSLGVLWKAPYRIDVTDALKSGSNQLEIRVTNLWPNRMIGDKQPGATKIAFATLDPYKADSPLLESGLIGPVRVSTLAVGTR
jgi:alpha-L-rhamnosidase/Glycosyl hydrolases family 2, sugar binding domain